MLIDRTHRLWAVISTLIFLTAALFYAMYAASAPNGPRGGSVMGLFYGIVGTLMMLFAGLLAVRKRYPGWGSRLGSAQFWLRGHIWLGSLSFPLILFHSGFGWGGPVENVLWITFGLVLVTGFYGLAAQHVIPRMITNQVPYETFTEQIPYLCNRMQFLSDTSVAKLCGKLDVDYKSLVHDAKKVAHKEGWLKRDGDFEKRLFDIYESAPPFEAKRIGKTAPKGVARMTPPTCPSPIQQSEATAPARVAGPEPDTENRATNKPRLPLEQLKAHASADKPANDSTSEKKLSPLELARQQGENSAPNGTSGGSAAHQPKSAQQPATALPSTPAKDAAGNASQTAPPAKPTTPNSPSSRRPPISTRKKKSAPDVSPERLAILKKFYVHSVRPFLDRNGSRVDGLSDESQAARRFSEMRRRLPIELYRLLGDLELCCIERRDFKKLQRMHHWLHYWLIVHIPVSIALLVLIVVHVIMAFRVVPFSSIVS